jgi:hypothetical protein
VWPLQAVVFTLLPKFTVGLATNGAGAAGVAAFDPSLSPSASVPTLEAGAGTGVLAGAGTGVLAGLTPEMLDMGFALKFVDIYSFDTFRTD